MCGVLGLISDSSDMVKFKKVLTTLKHRGPFSDGIWESPGVILGMVRLPMSSTDQYHLPLREKKYVVSYNGEIYSLTKKMDLLAESRAIIRGIESRVFPDGMYAFSVYDFHSKILTLGRDRFGIKPLYYYHDPIRNRFAYSSEIKTLLELIGKTSLNQEALGEILMTGVNLDFATPFHGIFLLPPGMLLKVSLDNPATVSLQWEELKTETPCEKNLDQLLDESVRQCCQTHRDVGLLVSGGIDSNLLQTFLPANQLKFHVTLENFIENGVPLNQTIFTDLKQSDFISTLQSAVANFGVPTRMTSILMYQNLANAIHAEGIYCVLLGEGADELFWGYPRHQAWRNRDYHLDVEQVLKFYFGDPAKMGCFFPTNMSRYLMEKINSLVRSRLQLGADATIRSFDLKYSLEPLLRRADHILMSQTIEARLPFLHHGIPEVAQKIGRENLSQNTTKTILVETLKKRNPLFRVQPKQHFRIPFIRWTKARTEMNGYIATHFDFLRKSGLSNLEKRHLEDLDTNHCFTMATLVAWWQNYGGYLL